MQKRKTLTEWNITPDFVEGLLDGVEWQKDWPIAYNPRLLIMTFKDGLQIVVRPEAGKVIPYLFWGSITVERDGKRYLDEQIDIQPGDVWTTGVEIYF